MRLSPQGQPSPAALTPLSAPIPALPACADTASHQEKTSARPALTENAASAQRARALYGNHSSWGARQFDKYTANTLSIPSAYFHPGGDGDGNEKFLAYLGSGHPFKWSGVPNAGNQPDIEIGIRFNSIQQGYEQVKHSQIHPNQDLTSCGVACLVDNEAGLQLLVSNESGHFQPSFSALAEREGAENQAWRKIASGLERQLQRPVSIAFQEFTGDPLHSLEHFQGALTASVMDNRKAFLDRSYPHLSEPIAKKLLRGEKIFCLEEMTERIRNLSNLSHLSPQDRISLGEMTERLEGALKQIKTKETKLSKEWREKVDRASSVVRRGRYTREARHHDRVQDLQQTLVNLKMNIAVAESSPSTQPAGSVRRRLPDDAASLRRDIDHLMQMYWR